MMDVSSSQSPSRRREDRILVLDDDPNVLSAMRRTLRGFRLTLCEDPHEALQLLGDAGPFAVLITDLRMPGMDGIQVLEKAADLSPDTHRILLTGHARLDAAVDAINRGKLQKFLIKPCPAEDLRLAVNEGIEHYYQRHLQREREQQLHYQATHDPLTDLPNRTLVMDRLQQAIERARRFHTLVSVMFIDLNGFKSINDNYGHDVGDDVLRRVARALEGLMRRVDTVARIGGDEFVIVAQDLHERRNADEILRRVLGIFETPLTCQGGHAFDIGASVGMAIYPNDALSPVELLRISDQHMYRIKKGVVSEVSEAGANHTISRR